jgi:hypothetical protein
MSVEIRPFPRPERSPLPFDGCVGVDGKVLVREEEFFVAMLRYPEHATIHEHPGIHDRRLHRGLRLHVRRRGDGDAASGTAGALA